MPGYGRPRGDRPAVGRAAPRVYGSRPSPGHRGYRAPGYGYPRYSHYGHRRYGYGYRGNYRYRYPYFGYGSYGYPGYGYGYPGSYFSFGYGYGGVGIGLGVSYAPTYRVSPVTGNLRLKVKPRDAQVLVDGYFVGVVDDFDGSFQRLQLEAGPHQIGISAEGYEPLVFDVRILPRETITYEEYLRPIPIP